MTGRMMLTGLAALLAGCAGTHATDGARQAWTARFTPAPAARPTTGISLPLGKCVNLGNMLEPPTEAGWGGRPFEDADAARIRARGFSSVRLPVRFSGHALDAPPYTIDPAFMARVRHVVEANLDAGLNVLLEIHAYDAMYSDPDGNRDRLAGLWRQIAAEFRTAPDGLWFELINEPHDRLGRSNLLETLAPALAAVRETNPTRPVIIGGENWSGVDSLAVLELPDDPYVVPTFHYYEPFDFTHQGADWVDPPPPVTRRDFGSDADRIQLAATLDKVRTYMARTGRVPFVGEYGAYERIRTRQRADYYRTISAAFASIGVQSCAWAYVNTFPLWRDRSGWIEPIVGGIVTTTGD
jgi:endoglucanase